MKTKFYITAAIPYVNAAPHIGHALEFVQTDTIARYHRLKGEAVLALSGGDENALKNVLAARAAHTPIQKFVDKNTELYHQMAQKLTVQFDIWQKGSDQKHHYPSSQKLWQLCAENNDIYKKPYSGLYCVGCETFYSPEELDKNGECFEHPGKKLDKISEENYFFRLSRYQDQLETLIKSKKLKIIPRTRQNETLKFIKSGLKDISISRSNQRAKNWGVPVPNDPTQRIYVWFDALNIYQTGVGFGWNQSKYRKWWPADLHVIGKGITRFHAIYWPAILLSAHLSLPKSIFVHDYFTVNGQKMSKTVGNIVDPLELIQKYGPDPLRYYFLAKFSPFTDGDFSENKLIQAYNSDLANGLGNLIARTAQLCATSDQKFTQNQPPEIFPEIHQFFRQYRFDQALTWLWEEKLKTLDKYIEDHRPWELKGQKLHNVLNKAVGDIRQIAYNLQPFLPQTAQKIITQFSSPSIKPAPSLFPRISQKP